MHAIIYNQQRAEWQETPDPGHPGEGEIQIRVAFAGVNRADLMQRAGHYPPPPGVTEVPGLEVSGIVSAVGEGVSRPAVGDRVCALLAGGGYAEAVNVDARQALPLPDGLDLRQGAALPEVFATAWLNLFMEGSLQPGERALIHAGASGVGSAAIQLCRAFGHPCLVTAGSQAKLDACAALGADAGFNRHDGSFADAVKARGGADVILDPVGASYLPDNQRVLNTEGRLVLIGIMGGRHAELDMGRMLLKRQRLLGSTLRGKSSAAKGAIMQALHEHVWPLLEKGDIHALLDHSWPIEQMDEAHDRVESNANTGKVLLDVNPPS